MNTRGLSIVEVVIALVILTIVLAGLLPSFIGNLQINNRTELKGAAVVIAQRKLEQLRRQDLTKTTLGTQTTGPTTEIATENGREFSVNTTFCRDVSRCIGSARQIVVEVFYPKNSASKLYEVETVYTQFSSTP